MIGIWISPLGHSESTKFGKFWTVIGVGSGITLKWAFDHALKYQTSLRAHWLVTAVFAISCLITIAAVYNSCAYNDSLEVFVRIDPAKSNVSGTSPVQIKATTQAEFYARVVGPDDPASHWELVPATLGSITQSGSFTAGPGSVKGKVTAFNLEDPTLSNYIDVEVVP